MKRSSTAAALLGLGLAIGSMAFAEEATTIFDGSGSKGWKTNTGKPLPDPRTTKRPWSPRYAVRRAAWHVLDHAWEIEDRAS